jgi:hypothetical protein
MPDENSNVDIDPITDVLRKEQAKIVEEKKMRKKELEQIGIVSLS